MERNEQEFTLIKLLSIITLLVTIAMLQSCQTGSKTEKANEDTGSYKTVEQAYLAKGCKKLESFDFMECADYFYAHGSANVNEIAEKAAIQKTGEAKMISTLQAIYEAAAAQKDTVTTVKNEISKNNEALSKQVLNTTFGGIQLKWMIKLFEKSNINPHAGEDASSRIELVVKLQFNGNDSIGYFSEQETHKRKITGQSTAVTDSQVQSILRHSGSFAHAQSVLGSFLKRNNIKSIETVEGDSVDVVLLIPKEIMQKVAKENIVTSKSTDVGGLHEKK